MVDDPEVIEKYNLMSNPSSSSSSSPMSNSKCLLLNSTSPHEHHRLCKDLSEYKRCLVGVAEKILQQTPEGSLCIFVQTDIKYKQKAHGFPGGKHSPQLDPLEYNEWVSKFALLHKACEQVSGNPPLKLIWHRLALRSGASGIFRNGKVSQDLLPWKTGRPQFSHCLCFQKGYRCLAAESQVAIGTCPSA